MNLHYVFAWCVECTVHGKVPLIKELFLLGTSAFTRQSFNFMSHLKINNGGYWRRYSEQHYNKGCLWIVHCMSKVNLLYNRIHFTECGLTDFSLWLNRLFSSFLKPTPAGWSLHSLRGEITIVCCTEPNINTLHILF